ncbi:MAG: hypothetical protein IPF94_10965 [Betaproteobacteria bacterium]|nr:hypothetical protein [Betaproteobacteria bacterium]
MPIAEIGRWEFVVPDDWELKDSGIGISYIEAPDGTKGLYSKTINSDPPKPSARCFAEYIQQAHRRGFDADPEANWSVMEDAGLQEGDLYRSRLDLWDGGANYRVLSIVLCSAWQAVQLTMHDYLCADLEASNPEFNKIECSVRLAAGAA